MTSLNLTNFPYKAVLWDVDDTLIDSERFHAEAVIRTAREFDVDITEEIFTQTTGMAHRETYEWLEKHYPHDTSYAVWLSYVFDFYSEITDMLQPRVGICDAIRGLAAAGVPQIAISNSMRRIIDPMLVGLAEVYGAPLPFEFTVAVEDMPAAKPDPRGYLETVARLGLTPSDCLAIEDSSSGVGAVKAAKINLVHWPINDLRDICTVINEAI